MIQCDHDKRNERWFVWRRKRIECDNVYRLIVMYINSLCASVCLSTSRRDTLPFCHWWFYVIPLSLCFWSFFSLSSFSRSLYDFLSLVIFQCLWDDIFLVCCTLSMNHLQSTGSTVIAHKYISKLFILLGYVLIMLSCSVLLSGIFLMLASVTACKMDGVMLTPAIRFPCQHSMHASVCYCFPIFCLYIKHRYITHCWMLFRFFTRQEKNSSSSLTSI